MPIFDNELPKSPIGGNDIKLPEPVLGSPSRPQVNTNLGGFGVPETGSTGLGLDQLADLANIPNKQNTFDSPFTAVPKSELLANQRYSMYQRNSDLENIYGLQQSWASQLGNSLVNMGVTAIGTFAQGFANIPNAIAAAQSGNVAKLSGDVDGYEGSIDNWIKNVKDDFPNYYTRYEKEHPYLAMIPGFRGSANFWGDKVITNFGFTIGAIGSAIAQDAIIGAVTGGIGAIPLIGSQIGRASLALNKIFAGTNDLNKVLNVGKIVAAGEQAILNTTNLARAAQYVKLTNGFKYGVGIIGSAQTEAGVESRDGYRQVKEALTKQYKLDHLGEEPTGKDAEEIESYATSSMNTRFGINMALLTVSNAIQFGTLFKSLKNTAKGPITGGLVRDLEDAGKIGLKKGSLDVFEKQAVTALPEKIWESVRPRLADILREGVYEEGGQFAAERGTYDYYTRKYKDPNRKSNVNNWNQLDQVIKSTGYGLAEQFGSQEGFENMIVGAISGMLMGGAMGKFDKLRGQGKDARLQSSINIINRYGVTGIMSDKYNDTLSSIGNSQEMQDAAKSGDVFKFKNLKEDQFFTFVQSRIPSGMHDVTIDQLDMLKDLSKEQFEQTFGMEFNESNKSTVSEYVDGLIVKANEIKTTTDALNNVFKNPFTYTADPKTPEEQNISDKYKAFESWKIDLSYYANIEPNANARLASIQQSVANISPLLNNDLIAKLANKEGIKELGNLYEERAAQLNKTITEFTTPVDKASIKAQVKALRTASERINLTDIYDLNTFDFLLNFELNNQDATKDRMISPEKMFDIFTYAHDINRLKFRKKRAGEIYEALSSEKGFNDYFKQQEDIINQNKPEEKTVTTPEEDEAVGPQFTNKYGQKEDIQIGREYQISAFKKAQVDKLDEDRWQVTAPDGTLTFHKTEEKAKEVADELNIDFVSLGKVRVLSINPDGTFKVEDLDGNIQNINPDKLSGYEKVQTRQEQLLKFAENIDKEQQEIENNSGVVATGNNVADITEMAAVPWEDKRKPTSMLFTSSKTESEGSETWEAPIESAPHITRSREFMSNAAFFPNRNDIYSILVTSNNEKALGLEGLASLSLNGNVGNVNDPKGGFLAQVFVQYKNGKREFIDKNGQPITEGNVLDQVIFQTMPTTSLTAEDSKSNKYDLHRKGEKEQAEIEKQRYTAFREVLFNDTSANPHMYKFNISRGIPLENIIQVKDAKGNVTEISYEKNNIVETLLPTDVEELINTQQGLITLSTDGTIVHHGESVKVPKGRPVFQYGDTMIPVWNAQFNSSDAKSIYEVIKLMGEGIDDLSKMRPYTTFLKNVLYWKRSSGNKSQNQIYIDTTNMQLHLGKESYDISEIPNLETTITNQLKTIFANVNNDGLTKNFTSSFREFYFEDGQLKNREWNNYQTYLLDNKYPDGSNRSINDTPLSTSVAKRTPAVPFNFKQRYSTLSDIDMPNVEVTPKAVVEVKPVPTESKTYTFPSGNAVQYVSEIKDGKIYIDPVSGILDGELVTKTANDPAQVAKFKSTLEDTEGLSNKEIVKLALSITLTDLLNKEPVAPTAPIADNTYKGPIKTTPKSEQENAEIISDEGDVQLAEARIEKIIATSKSLDEFSSRLTYTFDMNTRQLLNKFVQDRIDGKTTQTFSEWRNGKPTAPVVSDEKADIEKRRQEELDKYKSGDITVAGVKAINAKYNAELAALEAPVSDIEAKKAELKKQIEALPDNMIYGAHVTGDDVAKNIYDTQFKYSLGTALQGTVGLTSKKGLLDLMNNLLDGKSPHRNQFGVFILAFPKSEFGETSADRKVNLDTIESDMIDSYPEYLEGKIPTKFNFGYFKDGILFTKNAELEDYNPENTSEPEDQYKKVGVKEEGKETITEVDIAAFRKYVAEVAPGIPYEFVDNYIDVVGTDEKAYGVFTNGMAKIFKGATRGSEYHELMEGIWNGFLSPEQQQAIIDEFKSSKGKFTDRETGKKIAYSDATDTQAKERIMDNFSDFRLGKLPAKNISEKILRFFKAIINWFKNLLVNDKLQKALFKKVETGGFKEFKLNDSIKYLPPQYKKVERLSYTKANLFVQDMVIRASNIMFGKKKEDLYNFRAITGNDVFNEIEQLYIKEGKRQELGDKAWQQLVQRTKDNLRTLLGVQFSDEVEEVTNQEGANNRDYAKDPFDVDMKSNSFGIRLTLGTLPLVTTKKIPGVLPERQSSDVKGYKLLEFDKAFGTVLDRLSNTTSIPKAIDKLVKLANQDPTYVRVFQRIGGDPTTMTINFDSFKDADWRLFIDFMGTFTRMKPDVVIQYINGNEVFIGEANLFSAVRTLTDSWINNIRELARTPKSYIKYVKETQTYQADEQLFKDTNIKGIEGKIGFLNNLGITFPMEVYNKLNDKDKDEIGEQASKLFTYLQNVKDFVTLSRDVLNVKDRLNTIAEIYIRTTNPLVDNTYEGIDGKTRQAYALNNAVSVFVNDFNESDSFEDLKNKRPELNDVFSEHSLTLKKGGLYFDKKGKRIDGVKLNIGVIGGTFNNNKDKGIASVKLNKGARFTQEFNENIVGKYYVINPADANSEWEVNLRNHVSFDDVQEGLGWSKIYNIFNGYLKDDISLALDSDNRTPLKNVGEKSKELRFFKDILSSKTLKGLEPLISNGVIRSQIDDYIKTNQADINESIKAYIENNVNRLFNALRETEQIFKISDITYSFSGLLSKFAEENELNKMTLTKNDIDNITKYVAINKIIALIEYHKILVGDPLQFKIKEEEGDITYDETKRLKSWQSPRKTTFDTVEFRNYYNTQYNKTGLPGEENRISLTPDDIGYSVFDQFINTSTIEDVTVVGSLVKNLANYFDVNESDANSIISDILFRQVKLRNAQWPKEAEAFHQWQMAYTRKQLAKKKVYDYKDNTALKEHDEKLTSKPSPQYKIEVLKPIVTGNKFRKNYFDQILDKFSQMPLYYSAVENKGLEDLYIKMWKEKRGYIIAESGRKVGTEERHKLYNSEFKFNNEPFNNLVQVPWKAYGIQVENEYNDANGEVASGSQITKIISVNLFNNGVPISTDAEKYYTRNTNALKAILKNGFTSYLNKMGLKDVGANYEIVDRKKLAESLEFIMLQRTVSDNVRDTIQLDENNQFLIPFESSPAYVQIRDIIYSILDKSIVSRKTSGGAYVQAPVTLWENSKIGRRIALKTDTGYEFITRDKYNSLSEKEKKNVVLTDDTLRMPTIDDPYMEIFIPSWFKVKLGVGTKFADETALLKYLNGTKEGQKILKGIAFRTPSQAPSSIDAIRVKGFLPDYMGKTVIVPSEITKKTNSDFDIDKLSIYLKSIYKDKNGDIRLIEYKGSEEATKEFYADVFDEVLENSKIEKAKLLEAAQILSYGLDDPNNLVDRYFNLLNTLLEGVSESTNIEDSIIKQLEKLGDANIQAELKNKFINSSYKKALENEYYESLEEIMSLPETFIQRITPVDDAGLEDLANEIDRLRGFTESGIQNKIVDGVYLTNTRHNMALAKSWVGRAAINITSQSNTQKGKVVISYERIEKLEDARDKELLGNGKLLLPHNPLTINGVDYISISNVTDTNGEYISHILSGYGTAFVDVANKPFIVKIVKSDLAVNTFLFLTRATVRKSDVGKFMSQPIIDEYLTMLDNQGASNLYGKTNINTIKQKFGASESLIAQIETLDVDEFDSNIEKYYKYKKEFTDLENAKQQFILNEFLKYAKMADYSFDVNQALNYDTTSFRSGDILFQKQLKTKKALESNIFIGIQDILDNTFLGDQADLLDDAFAATGEILVLEKPEFRDITDKLLTPFAIKKYLSKDDFSKIGNKIKLSFLDFIINTKSEINEDIQSLLIDSQTSAVNQLAIAKRDYPNLAILNELEQVNSTRENGVKTIKLKVNLRNNPNIINLYTDYMRELRENPNTRELFNNLVKLAILQGVYKSPVSLNPIIPVESYAEIVSPIITGLVADNTLDAFSKGAFQRNNFKNNDIFYQIEPKFFGSQYDPMTEEPTYYTSKTYFPIGGEFNISLQDRKILILSEAWNYAATTYDYIKFPRVIKETRKGVPTGTYIDAVTGKPITERGLKIMREKGNLSASDIFGYQKVRDNEGKPLTIEENGEVKHVYKLINLYGDGNLTTEYYTDFRPSVINNGTITINEEIPDEDIIRYYLDKKQVVLKENNVSLPPQGTQLIPVQPDVEFAIDGNIYYMKPNGNITYSNGSLVKDSVIINQVSARKQIQEGNIKVAVFDGVDYFVLSNGKIIDATKEDFGEEPTLTEKEKEIILAKAITYKKNC